MILNIKATRTELTSDLRAYIEKKLEHLDKFITGDDDSALVSFEIERTTNHHQKGDVHRAEVKINLGGNNFYADSTNEDIYTAIDEVKDEVVRELKSFKNKSFDKEKAGGRKVKKILKS